MSSVRRAGLLPLNPDLKSGPGIEFESRLGSLVVGQEGAVHALASLYQIFQAGMSDPSRPLGTMLFLGPTGSGKTHVVEAAAEILFGSATALIKIDCAEFQHSHEIAKLIGSPPGYLGHRETAPLLTQENIDRYHTKRDPFTLVLFDEIEKASESLWQLLLGILDKATVTLGDNRRIDLSQTMIIMTSNLGAKEMSELITGAIGFAPAQGSCLTGDDLERKIHRTAVEAAKRRFSPEFMNRIDKIAVFRSLSREELRKILDLELDKVRRRIEEGGGERFSFTLTDSAKDFLLSEGTDLRYGARHLKRAIERHLVYPMANLSVSRQVRLNDAVIVDYDQERGRLNFFLDRTGYSNGAINFAWRNGLPWGNYGRAGYGGVGNRRSSI